MGTKATLSTQNCPHSAGESGRGEIPHQKKKREKSEKDAKQTSRFGVMLYSQCSMNLKEKEPEWNSWLEKVNRQRNTGTVDGS